MTTKRKPVIREKCTCEKEEIINRMSVLIVGNGDPEKGLLYKINKVTDDIATIKDELKGINENNNVLLKEITIVGGNLREFETTIKTKEGVKKEDEVRGDVADQLKLQEKSIAGQLKSQKSRDNWYKVLTIIGLAIAIYFGIRNNKKNDTMLINQEGLKTQVDYINTPVENSRGGYDLWPSGLYADSIRKIKDSIK